MSVIVKSAGGGSIMKKDTLGIASYLALVGNVNTDMVDAALGKNNEDRVKGVGLALAMYAKFKDPTIDINTNYAHMKHANTLAEIFVNGDMMVEFFSNSDVIALVEASPYGKEQLTSLLNEQSFTALLNVKYGENKKSLDEFWTDNLFLNKLYNDYEYFNSLNLGTYQCVVDSLLNSSVAAQASALMRSNSSAVTLYTGACLIIAMWGGFADNTDYTGGYEVGGETFKYRYATNYPIVKVGKQIWAANIGGYGSQKTTIYAKYIPITLE